MSRLRDGRPENQGSKDDGGHSLESGDDVKNAWSSTSTPHVLMAWCLMLPLLFKFFTEPLPGTERRDTHINTQTDGWDL
jgi:hypothetical protein